MKYNIQLMKASFRSKVVFMSSKITYFLVWSIFAFSLLLVNEKRTFARELPHHEITANANDFALREALLAGNLEEFDHYLSLGANPTEWLDNSKDGWVFCAAAADGREEFLRLLVVKGYNFDFRQVDIGSSISLPLTCAVMFNNLQALDILVTAGADPTAAPSIKFPNRIPMSVMSQAIIIGLYDLAVWLFDKGNYSDEQLRSDIRMLEKFPVNESAPGNVYRLMLVDLFRQKGYEVTPWTREKATAK